MLLKKRTTLKRMEEILATVNTRVVKEILIEPGTSNSPNRFDWCDITIDTITYTIWLCDSDPELADRAVEELKKMLSKFDLPYVLRPEPYIYHQQNPPFEKKTLYLSDIRKPTRKEK